MAAFDEVKLFDARAGQELAAGGGNVPRRLPMRVDVNLRGLPRARPLASTWAGSPAFDPFTLN
jgi:hypothetical protein